MSKRSTTKEIIMSNLDITTLKEKLKNIPTPRPRTIDWCDEYPTSYGDATMRHSAAPTEKQSNQVSDSYHNSYHKQEINVCVKDYTYDEQSFILIDLQAIIKQLFTGVSMVGIPAPGTILSLSRLLQKSFFFCQKKFALAI